MHRVQRSRLCTIRVTRSGTRHWGDGGGVIHFRVCNIYIAARIDRPLTTTVAGAKEEASTAALPQRWLTAVNLRVCTRAGPRICAMQDRADIRVGRGSTLGVACLRRPIYRVYPLRISVASLGNLVACRVLLCSTEWPAICSCTCGNASGAGVVIAVVISRTSSPSFMSACSTKAFPGDLQLALSRLRYILPSYAFKFSNHHAT